MPSPISYKVSDHKVKLVLSIDRYASQRERGTTPVLRGLSFLNQMRRQMKDSPKKELQRQGNISQRLSTPLFRRRRTKRSCLSRGAVNKSIVSDVPKGLPEGAASCTFTVAEHSTREGG